MGGGLVEIRITPPAFHRLTIGDPSDILFLPCVSLLQIKNMEYKNVDERRPSAGEAADGDVLHASEGEHDATVDTGVPFAESQLPPKAICELFYYNYQSLYGLNDSFFFSFQKASPLK